jgi:hypothetical protein
MEMETDIEKVIETEHGNINGHGKGSKNCI